MNHDVGSGSFDFFSFLERAGGAAGISDPDSAAVPKNSADSGVSDSSTASDSADASAPSEASDASADGSSSTTSPSSPSSMVFGAAFSFGF